MLWATFNNLAKGVYCSWISRSYAMEFVLVFCVPKNN